MLYISCLSSASIEWKKEKKERKEKGKIAIDTHPPWFYRKNVFVRKEKEEKEHAT